MNIARAVLSGALIWFLVLTLFGVMDFFPATHDSPFLQRVIASLLIIPFAWLGAIIYYNTGDRSSGLLVGGLMVVTALILDALITVPLIEQPYHGVDHRQFFINPLLWIIALEDLFVIWFYYKIKIERR